MIEKELENLLMKFVRDDVHVLISTAIVQAGFFFSSRRRHTRLVSDWSSDVCSSDLSRARRAHPGDDSRRRRVRPRIIPRMSPSSPATATVSDTCLTRVRHRCSDTGGIRSEERRVGEEGRSRWSPYHLKKQSAECAKE